LGLTLLHQLIANPRFGSGLKGKFQYKFLDSTLYLQPMAVMGRRRSILQLHKATPLVTRLKRQRNNMSNLLKDIYSVPFYDKFSNILEDVLPNFNKHNFTSAIFTDNWGSKELKQRMRHTSLVLHQFLPADFTKTSRIFEILISRIQQNPFTQSSLEFMFFPDYIEIYGIEDFETSVKTIEFVTQFTSCEFAVRPFIIKYGERMLQQMYQWSLHENHHVRRLASEGSRPRLPWAMALPELKRNPKPILPLLDNLKNDVSEYVRRSVANNLNDIAKDNPDIVIQIAKQWKGKSKETEAIIKHGCRTLLKQGNSDILKFFGLADNPKVQLIDFKIRKKSICIGENLAFSFSLQNNDKKTQFIRLEYAVYYLRKNGQLSKKVFKISERQLNPGEIIEIQRKQSFKIITTRQFYIGQQKLGIIINGQERDIDKFELTE
jgi:3-methyladenine DNA glycosylase AlkC